MHTTHQIQADLSFTGAELPSQLPRLGPFAHTAPGCLLLPICPHLNFKAQVLSSPQKSLKVKLPTTSIFKFLLYLLVAWLKWQPTPVFLPEESHEQRSLATSVHGVAKGRT